MGDFYFLGIFCCFGGMERSEVVLKFFFFVLVIFWDLSFSPFFCFGVIFWESFWFGSGFGGFGGFGIWGICF